MTRQTSRVKPETAAQTTAAPPKRLGLALSGGAALGAAHIGVLQVLQAHGIQPDLVTGSSAGSAVGALLCAGVPPDQMVQVALRLRWSRLGKVVRPRRGFFDGRRLEEYLVQLIGDLTFDQLQIPLGVAAADILTEELVILHQGRVAPAVRASCSVPGIFTPVEHGDRLLVDGGLINNLPVSAVRDMGADFVIAVDLSAPLVGARGAPTSLLDMWILTLATLVRNVHREAELADVIITPQVGEFNPADLSKIAVVIERGREAAAEMLPRILQGLDREG
jgi:NTE family protein